MALGVCCVCWWWGVLAVLLVCFASGPQQGITMDKVQLEPRFFKGVLQVRSSRASPAPHAPPLSV